MTIGKGLIPDRDHLWGWLDEVTEEMASHFFMQFMHEFHDIGDFARVYQEHNLDRHECELQRVIKSEVIRILSREFPPSTAIGELIVPQAIE